MPWMWKTYSEAQKEHETAPFWEQSGASIHMKEEQETGADQKKETAEKGRKLRSLENAYGKITFYSVEGQRIGIEAARTGGWQEDTMKEARRKLDGDRVFPVNMEGGKGYTDSHQKEQGAFLWSETADFSGERIMNELRRLSVELRQDTLSEMMPEAVRERMVHGHLPIFRKIEEGIKKSLEEIHREEEQPAPAFLENSGGHQKQEKEDGTEEDDGVPEGDEEQKQ